MFWGLVLAHFLADYPLQNSWMVNAKRHWKGLLVHVSMHVVVMCLLAWGAWAEAWRYILVLAVIHYAIDTLKNFVNVQKPQWVIGPYLFDQALHMLSIYWIARWAGGLALPLGGVWQVYAVGFLIATHVWFITERILYHADPAYLVEVNAQHWPRMLARALGIAAILLGWRALGGVTSAALAVALPYRGPYRLRAAGVDICVIVLTSVFMLWVA